MDKRQINASEFLFNDYYQPQPNLPVSLQGTKKCVLHLQTDRAK